MKTILSTALCALLVGGSVNAAVGPDKAAQLGTTLTDVGAEKAGNADGTIPAYTGGLATAPAGFDKATGKRPSPFAAEKPLYSIDGKNVEKYADKLTAGALELLKKYPDFHIDVYPTHRTAAYPKLWTDNTKKCAVEAKTTDAGLGLEPTSAHNCVPFPIPQDGYEVMWNHLFHYRGSQYLFTVSNYNVNGAGHLSLATSANLRVNIEFQDPAPTANNKVFGEFLVDYFAPARHDGEKLFLRDMVNEYRDKRQAWQYLPGQRRVRLAPDIAFDTPNPATNGTSTWDDVYLFNGSMERYDMKLIGKKELYVPYNDNQFVYQTPAEESLKAKFINPDVARWELHRVWVVEATLKTGQRHIYTKRVFYVDEDTWFALASDQYDAHNQLFRAGFVFPVQNYDVPAPYGDVVAFYDLIAGSYSVSLLMSGPKEGIWYDKTYPPGTFSADTLVGSGVR